MSRIISEAAAAALEAGRDFKQSNTRVDGHAQEMYLHGNLIAKVENGALYITLETFNNIKILSSRCEYAPEIKNNVVFVGDKCF